MSFVVMMSGMVGGAVSAAGASEPASFIARVEQSQGLAPAGANGEAAAAPSDATRTSEGEPASFIARVEQSQGLAPAGANGEAAAAPSDATRTSEGEPASFIARVEQSQLVFPAAALAREDQLSPEQIRLIQRTLADDGYPTPASGQLDNRTRSSLMAFQRSRSLPVSGHLDSMTVDALGVAPSEVAPVRGTSGDR
jgi:hypothetical protein